MSINEHLGSLKRLFAEHAAASFPEECENVEIDGVDLEEINGTIVGCVAVFLGRSYQAVHEAELRRCQEELEAVLPKLAGNAHAYFTRLRRLVNLVLEPVVREAGYH